MKSMKAFNLASTKKKLPHVLDRKTAKGAKDLDDLDRHAQSLFMTEKEITKRLYKTGEHFRWSNEKIVEILSDNHSLKNVIFPYLISMYIRDKRILRKDADQIRQMLKSEDSENWVLAISILKQKRRNSL